MGNIIKLPLFDAVKGSYVDNTGSYKEYQLWRKSESYKLWLKKQWKRQDGKCAYCRCELRGIRHNVDHILPQILKTRNINSSKNLVLSCPQCNKRKGSTILKKSKRPTFK